MGQEVTEDMRAKKCVEPTRVTATGEQISPCGMKATSLFNDTFQVTGFSINSSNIGWESDYRRYNNPPDYPTRPDTSWLFDRYPEVVPESEGVKNRHFISWMRPGALSRIWKPYGHLYTDLEAGVELEIQIHSNFPVGAWGGFKQLVLTEVDSLGGRHSCFGYVLLGSGVICTILTAIISILHTEKCEKVCMS